MTNISIINTILILIFVIIGFFAFKPKSLKKKQSEFRVIQIKSGKFKIQRFKSHEWVNYHEWIDCRLYIHYNKEIEFHESDTTIFNSLQEAQDTVDKYLKQEEKKKQLIKKEEDDNEIINIWYKEQ